MVKLSQMPYWQTPQEISPSTWLARLSKHYRESPLIQHATELAFLVGNQAFDKGEINLWQQGLSIAETLLPLNVDAALIAAAMLYPIYDHADINLRDIQETLSPEVSQLLAGAEKMHAVSDLHNTPHKSTTQIENCRKMLLAMAEDLRVVLLKLAERLHALRLLRFVPEAQHQKLGEEIFSVYAPLANRLGIGHIKWEMEDLAFRAINPKIYKAIAKQLDMKRIEREAFIQKMLAFFEMQLNASHFPHFELMGRAKHIYSIHKKISRKNVNVQELFDISAIRVLVDTIEECYRVLDIVQQNFENISEEFDDYIHVPKPNGYRSIHTAVMTPEGHTLEIQIRTFSMHAESELGVAAHWRYKEGGKRNQDYESKIAWLREIFSWQNEVEAKEKPEQSVLSDRVYVLTPTGDIMDLPKGATPLDFAYAIHTNIGHRCRGAKINGHMVPLTSMLHMGDKVEILTGKHPKPSRDWLNTHLGFLHTARARAKVAHWFRQTDFEKNAEEGKNTLERELKRLNLQEIDHDQLARKLDQPSKEAMYAAIGSGEWRQTALAGKLEQLYKSTPKPRTFTKPIKHIGPLIIEGASNLLTHFARCCNPAPTDALAGYISRHGVAIHKESCASFLSRKKLHPERVLSASWAK